MIKKEKAALEREKDILLDKIKLLQQRNKVQESLIHELELKSVQNTFK